MNESDLLAWLRESLPPADRIAADEGFLRAVVRHALAVRAETPWGRSVPEEIFRPFVLFPRVNNEDAVFYHAAIWRQLAPRLKGLTMEQAILEINFWCFEQATYRLTDDRTANALTVMRRGFGRCGEESVLLVCALRAAGIPARQVYVPRWSHCDDNHAWVEAWADGRWRYLGACEPEPVLDSGWFTASASKAMLVSTRAYGTPRAGETQFVNSTAMYAKTRLFTTTVLEGGSPRAGITVRFELANMAEFFPIYQEKTGEDGCVRLDLGLGTVHLHAHDGRRYLCRTVDTARESCCTLDFSQAVSFDAAQSAFHQQPPQETRIQPSLFPQETLAAHRRRMAACRALRETRHAGEQTEPNAFLRAARLNAGEIRRFLEDARFSAEDKTSLLASLREKDLADVSAETLCDALETALPAKPRYPQAVWAKSVLCPRIADEALFPVRGWFRRNLGPFGGAPDVWRAVSARVQLRETESAALCPNLRAAWEAGFGSGRTRDALCVSICRAHGVAARLNPVSGAKEFWDGGRYRAVEPQAQPTARLTLRNRAAQPLEYGVHFSIGALQNGVFETLRLGNISLADTLTLPVAAGKYRAVTCQRQIDGAIDGRVFPIDAAEGEEAVLDLNLAPDMTAEKLLHIPLPPYRAIENGAIAPLPQALNGRPAILAFLAPGEEPTEHFLNELLDAKALLNGQLAVCLLIGDESQAGNEKLRQVLAALPGCARLMIASDPEAELHWRKLLQAGDLRLPLAIAVNAAGKGLFAFTNYHVGSVQALIKMLDS